MSNSSKSSVYRVKLDIVMHVNTVSNIMQIWLFHPLKVRFINPTVYFDVLILLTIIISQ